jgi:hypothetical protein
VRITQISVFLENRPGRLAYLLQVLSDAQVNLRALSLADTADFGIARIIVSDVNAAVQAIRKAGLTAATNQVLCVEIPDTPGALARTLVDPLSRAKVNIEYTYAYSGGASQQATVVMKVDDLDAAEKVLPSRIVGDADEKEGWTVP